MFHAETAAYLALVCSHSVFCLVADTGLVPTKYPANPALGRWLSTQRSQYKLYMDGERSTMTEQRVRRLDSIGFVWCVLEHRG